MTHEYFNLKVSGFRVLRAYRSAGFGGSWMVYVQLGTGAGYRWIDLPGHSNNVAHPWRGKLTILGRTWAFGRNVRDGRATGRRRVLPWFSTVGFSRNGNLNVYPQW